MHSVSVFQWWLTYVVPVAHTCTLTQRVNKASVIPQDTRTLWYNVDDKCVLYQGVSRLMSGRARTGKDVASPYMRHGYDIYCEGHSPTYSGFSRTTPGCFCPSSSSFMLGSAIPCAESFNPWPFFIRPTRRAGLGRAKRPRSLARAFLCRRRLPSKSLGMPQIWCV